ncbi:AMP-binding enzyme, partial [Colletotrichum asianum]
EWNGEHVVIVAAVRLKAVEPLIALFLVKLQALQDGIVKGATQFPLDGIGVGVDNEWDGRGNAEDALKKSRCVRRQDTNALEAMLLQIVCKAGCSLSKATVGAAQKLVVGSDMDNRLRVGFNGGSTLQKIGWGKLMDVKGCLGLFGLWSR